jgi:hypothetical protein
MGPCCMCLANLLCWVLLEELFDLGSVVGRRRKVPLANLRLEVLYRDEGRSVSGIVALEGLDKLSRSSPRGC